MANKEIFNQQMNELADTINEKAGTSGKKTIPEMTETVKNIPSDNSYTLELNPLMSQETLMAFAAFCTGWTEKEWDAWYFSNEQGEPIEIDLTEYDQYDTLNLHYELYGDEGEVVSNCTIPFRKQVSTNGEPKFVMDVIGAIVDEEFSKSIDVTLDSTGLIGVVLVINKNAEPENLDKKIIGTSEIEYNSGDDTFWIPCLREYFENLDMELVASWMEGGAFPQDDRFVIFLKNGKVCSCSGALGTDEEYSSWMYNYGEILIEPTSESSASITFAYNTDDFNLGTSVSIETDAETGDSHLVVGEIFWIGGSVSPTDLEKMTIWRPLCNEHYGNGGGGGGAVNSVNGKTGNVVLNASDIGLGNVNNTSDMNKPISTAMQNALNGKLNAGVPVIIPGQTSGVSTTAAIRFTSDNIAQIAATKVTNGTSDFRLQLKTGDYGVITTSIDNTHTVSLGDGATTNISFATGLNGNLTHARFTSGTWITSNILDAYNTLPNPTLSGNEAILTSLKLNDVNYVLPTTIANPTVIGNEEVLTSISIAGTNYNITKPFIVHFTKNANNEYVQSSGTVKYADVLDRLNKGQKVIFRIFYQLTEERDRADYIAIQSWKDHGTGVTLEPVNIKAILGNYDCSGRTNNVIQIVPTNN